MSDADRIASLEAEVAALRKVITDHNIGCQQSCDARAESESCNRFHGYQRACSDCPVDWVIPSAAIDSAIAAKGK